MLPVVTRTLIKSKIREKSVGGDKERATVCDHLLQKHSFFSSCLVVASPVNLLSLSLLPKQVKWIYNSLCFLTEQTDKLDV